MLSLKKSYKSSKTYPKISLKDKMTLGSLTNMHNAQSYYYIQALSFKSNEVLKIDANFCLGI